MTTISHLLVYQITPRKMRVLIAILLLLSLCCEVQSFGVNSLGRGQSHDILPLLSRSFSDDSELTEQTIVSGGVEKYRNTATKVLSNFMGKNAMEENEDPLGAIDFDAPKISPTISLDTLAAVLDYELIEREWFVTGMVNPVYFSKEFEFQDPDVQVKGVEEYGRGVRKLFDQETSRAEIISTVVNTTTSTLEKPIITCTWRLSGRVNILFGLTIKPYIVYTDLIIDPKTSLILFQEDRFDLPPWDLFLSFLFPALAGTVTAPPAPPVEKRIVSMPVLKASSTLQTATDTAMDFLANFFNQKDEENK